MNFEWKMFDFTRKDCRQLASAVTSCAQLRLFRITRSKVSPSSVDLKAFRVAQPAVEIAQLMAEDCTEET